MKRLRVSEHAFELRPASVEEAGLFYLTTTGRLKKIDEVYRALYLADGNRIPLDDVIEIQSNWGENSLF